ncbi:hypothetical protein B296_00047457 [Ensete ventricosum]|uniref:Uncharacterized protein n=1 Tax=Ensete ventricosum TaxID=4639 RepID=A0A426WX28_ENSVE|nr:hypothetical protein B296_00047457 [Ensete ventricosum]
MVLTIAPVSVSDTQEEASLGKASACAFSLRGHDILRCRNRILCESGNTFFCRAARVRLHWTWGLQEPLFPYLEEDLRSSRVEGDRGGLAGNKPDLSSLIFGGGTGCPRDCSPRGRFVSSRLSPISISATVYWCARCSISGRVVGGRSISDQKNLDGLSPVKNAWMTRDEWRSGIPWTWDVNRPTNWERGSSLPWAIPRREVVVGLGHALAKKFSSNSLASKSNEGIDAGLRREYQVLAAPLRVVEKARHIRASEVS